MSTDEGVRAQPADDADAADEGEAAADPYRRRGGARRGSRREPGTGTSAEAAQPRFWHRDHPVFTPLAGFFTGVLLVVVVLGLLGALLDLVLGYDVGAHPWVFLVALGVLLAANLVLVVAGGTRRFARYMLFGVLTTPAVVVAVGALTLSLLIKNDG
ncbi:hypothetical protein [Nocardioides rubriscoriae]|uniref:hypothetical protein n=1 Tax=Nocardioides rubriscoriae TaxID=642762 RepID=UPI0011DF421C|nr:hypothetical protein [Nocardioides rubriscoriae]